MSLRFLTIDAVGRINDAFTGITGSLTLAFWIKVNAYDGSGYGTVISSNAVGCNVTSSQALTFTRLRATTNQSFVTSNSSLATGSWYHVAIVSTSISCDIYLNGVEASYATSTVGSGSFTAITTNVYTGLRSIGDRPLDGWLSDLRMYSRALSIAEVETLYQLRGSDGIVDGLVSRFPLCQRHPGADARAGVYYKDSIPKAATTAELAITLDVPACADGDLLVTLLALGSNANQIAPDVTTPTGWTLIGSRDIPATYPGALWAFRRQASSEPATYTFSFSQTACAGAAMIAYDGTLVDTAEDVYGTGSGTADPAPAPAVTTTAAAMVIRAVATTGQNMPAVPAEACPADCAEREEINVAGTRPCCLGVADQLKPTGDTGTASFDLTASTTYAAMTIAFHGGNGTFNSQDLREVSSRKGDGHVRGHAEYAEEPLSPRRR